MLKQPIIVVLSFLLLLATKSTATVVTDPPRDSIISHDTLQDSVRVVVAVENQLSPEESFRKKKLITAILAFPLPFGFTGLHRIYLGSEPWVPIVYLVTGGGGFGILPLIDFLYIITADEEEFKKYENNPKVFMFVD